MRKKGGDVVAYAKCSVEDYDELNKRKWSLKTGGYVNGSVERKTYLMHRFIKIHLEKVDIPKGGLIDHINNDRLDNRRSNLRIANPKQNALNRKKTKGNSKFHGVSYRKDRKKYRAYSWIDEEQITLGTFDNEIDAAKMYDSWALKQVDFKEGFRKLNFPEMKNEHLNTNLQLTKRSSSSKYIGVQKRESGVFRAVLAHNGKRFYLLDSPDEIKCAIAYDEYIYKNKLDKPMNFPEQYPNHAPDKEIKTEMRQVDETTIRLFIKSKPNVRVFINIDDYEKIKYEGLHINNNGYPSLNFKKNGNRLLHRYLLNAQDTSMCVDHINGVKTDCTRENLRIVTPQDNAKNKSKNPNAKSKYFGVTCSKFKFRIFTPTVKNEGKKIQKSFKNEEDAARYRDLYIIKNAPNSTYKMNFTWTPEEEEKWSKKLNL